MAHLELSILWLGSTEQLSHPTYLKFENRRSGSVGGAPTGGSRQSASLRLTVLFIFPSRYLFAIGLSPIFSLRQNLPPDLGCILKQPDSPTAPRGATEFEHNGALTLSGAPFRGLGPSPSLRTLLQTTIRTPRAIDFHGGLFPVRLPLLGESLLVSFPPLIDVLKFSG
ncbi:hypothetical protein L6164_026111 [Bauhinia variegata]|uniref:Uncharacterized protein n=1 Tax=Bauhinia variegata TaxID=167791 RepID=A0ACB9LPX5_BAUVA|nr:hypothetical protein L6164_026111 [Bauhinia variegata]